MTKVSSEIRADAALGASTGYWAQTRNCITDDNGRFGFYCEYEIREVLNWDFDWENREPVETGPDAEVGPWIKVTPATMQKGIDLLFSPGFSIADSILQDIRNEDIDALGGDCIIQAAILGELRYS
jgi:hypothetical protein